MYPHSSELQSALDAPIAKSLYKKELNKKFKMMSIRPGRYCQVLMARVEVEKNRKLEQRNK